MTPYVYNPLKDAKATRFVRLLPGTAGGIQCQLFRASLDDRVDYIALSYAWGSTRRDQSITCNGRSLLVTNSLMSALRRLRLPEEPRVFWIDAICINQDDTDERNRQVSLMCDIYQKALQLFIWLGPGDSHSTMAVSVMRKFALAQQELNSAGRLPYVHVKPEEWASFARLLQRAWFERLWIIQELAMGLQLSGASGPVFLCGVHRFGLADLKDACEWCNQLSFTDNVSMPEETVLRDIRDGVRRILVLCEMTKHTNPEEVRKGLWRHWLLSKVAATREKKATDPRDRLFALYGFLRDGDEPVAVADYSKSTATVFQEFALEYIVEAKCLDILSEVEEPCLRTFRSVPSWVPNWALETSRIPLLRQTERLGTQRARKLARQACGTLEPSICSMRDDMIIVDGTCYDTVSWVSQTFTKERLAHSKDSPSILLDIWNNVARFREPYPNSAPAIEAFYKTLICGREEDDRHAENFIAFWKSLQGSNALDMAKFCVNSPEMMQLLCRQSAGAEVAAQMVATCAALNEMHLDGSIDGLANAEPLFTALEMQTTLRTGDTIKSSGPQLLRNANAQRYEDLLGETARHRVFFTTCKGYMGLGVEGTEVGDLVTVLTGGKIPYILRKAIPGERRHTSKAPKSPYCAFKTYSIVASLVGEAYVHGLMHGEAVEKDHEVAWDRIGIV